MCKAIWQLCWNDECDFFHVSLSVTEPCEWGYELVAGSPDLRCHRTGKTIASESKTIEEVRGNCLACPVLPKGEPTLMRMIVECLKSPEALLPASATDKVYQWEVKHNGVIEIIIGIEGADDFKKAVEEFDSATTGAGVSNDATAAVEITNEKRLRRKARLLLII